MAIHEKSRSRKWFIEPEVREITITSSEVEVARGH